MICLFVSFEVKSEQIFITCEMKHVKSIGSDGLDLMKEWDRLGEGTYTKEFFVDSKKRFLLIQTLLIFLILRNYSVLSSVLTKYIKKNILIKNFQHLINQK